MNARWTTFLVALGAAVAVSAGPADAGKGKLRTKAKLSVDKQGVVYKERTKHTKGIRSRVTKGLLGKTVSSSVTLRGGSHTHTTKRGRTSATKETTSAKGGTNAASVQSRSGFFTGNPKVRRSGTTEVRDTGVRETSARHRYIGGSVKSSTERATARQGDSQSTTSSVRRDGTVKRTSSGISSRTRKIGNGRMSGKRTIETTGSSMTATDTRTRRWGVVQRLSLGRFGKKKVEVKETQTTNGSRVTITAPRAEVVRDTAVKGNKTVSTTTRSKRSKFTGRSRIKERSQVTITDGSGTRVTEKMRRNGTVKKRVTERVWADGSRRNVVERVRRDGTTRSARESESRSRADNPKRKDRRFSRKSFNRSGNQRTGISVERVNKKIGASVSTPIGSLGADKGRITGKDGNNR